MKRLLLAVALIAPAASRAGDYTDFQARVRTEYLKPFALDVGGLLGATSFHPGRSLGVPGFELGLVGAVQSRPDKDNRILRDAGVEGFGIPLVHAAVGLPFKVDLVAHGLSVEGLKVFGGGVRYGIIRASKLT